METANYILGIDLGSHSLGWAVLPLDADGQPCGITAAGVRTFEAGVEASPNEMMQGKQTSRAANRRAKRGPRRQFWRRAWRRYKTLKCLTENGLLPVQAGIDIRESADQHRYIEQIDRELREQLRPSQSHATRHLWEQRWLHELRASALERKLSATELGRALYHLAQHRGFLSNRKTDTREDELKSEKSARRGKKNAGESELIASGAESDENAKEDTQSIKASINQLKLDMEAAGAPTLGYYFARHVNPEEQRIRKRWTSREMYQTEFDAICDSQAQHHPTLAAGQPFRLALQQEIFFQRPLKSSGHLVGHCDLEPKRKRAVQAIPCAQRFRMLQRVNDLKITSPETGVEQALTSDERAKLVAALSESGDMTFSAIRKLLGLIAPRSATAKRAAVVGHLFNLEKPPLEKLPGDRTTARIRSCEVKAPGIIARWEGMSERQQEDLVLAIATFESAAALRAHLVKHFGFWPEQAHALSAIKLEESRCSLSRRAIMQLLPHMEEGMPFATAKEQFEDYKVKSQRLGSALNFLPPVLATDLKHVCRDAAHRSFMQARDLKNPAVTRSLTELRKVVNAVVRRHGKPARIHVEVARELKKPAKAREAIAKQNVARRSERDKAREQITAQIGHADPRDSDITRWLLGQEQGWHCPYCGAPMPQRSEDLHVDHIIPDSVCLDSSMANMVLCHANCNQLKAKRAPHQAFDAATLAAIAGYTRHYPAHKRARIQWTEQDIQDHYADESGGFTRRQLQDTQYAARLARDYLGMLYGGYVDSEGRLRVQASSGAVTAILRREWNLNGVLPSLPDSPTQTAPHDSRLDEKLRTDHRHHAIDAIVIALTSPRAITELSTAAARVAQAELRREDIRDSHNRPRRRFAEIPPPWGTPETFRQRIASVIADITVSRRAERKIQGPMHAETNYSREILWQGEATRRVRVPLAALSIADIEGDAIADPRVREAVRAKWIALGRQKPSEAFKNADNHPHMPPPANRPDGPVGPPIHCVRMVVTGKPREVGRDASTRYVLPGKDSIHHSLVLASKTSKGVCWTIETVGRLDVARRHRNAEPLIQSNGQADEIIMWLCKEDCIEMDDGKGVRRVFIVKSISQAGNSTDIKVRLHHDARNDKAIEAAGQRSDFRIRSPDKFRALNPLPVTIGPLGDILRPRRRASDNT